MLSVASTQTCEPLTEITQVEFIEYPEILPGLKQMGIEETTDDDLIRLEMPDPKYKVIHIGDPASKVPPLPDATVAERSKDQLHEVVDQILGKIHLNEVLVIPVANWRAIIDCVAFELATDESWLEIDAIAAIHQNTRNALAVPRSENRVLIDMIKAVMAHGSGPKQEFVITSDVSPMLVEVFHDGAVSLTCDAGVAETVSARVVDSTP